MNATIREDEIEELRRLSLRVANDSTEEPDERRMARIVLGVVSDLRTLKSLVASRDATIKRLAAEGDRLATVIEGLTSKVGE